MSDEKEEKSMRAGQFWLRGVVESITQKERGQYTDTIMRLFVKDEKDEKRNNTYGIKLFGKALDNLKANTGDEVEVTCYAKGRVWKESVFHDIALAFCKVLKASEKPAHDTESGTREVDAPAVESEHLPF